jgi:hypothetical protein
MAEFLFRVVGPLKVHRSRKSGGRIITDEDVRQFWQSYGKYANHRGCYIFGRHAGQGYTPGYVGKATKRLKQEIFTPDKLNKYHQFLIQRKKGAPILFFVLAPVRKGKANARQIAKVEKYLINLGVTANPDLINLHFTKPERWGIRGLIRGGKGKVARGIGDFRQMLGVTL